MYYVESDLSRKEYMAELTARFDNPFLIYDERVCGIAIGPFFSVAYHSPYEWNRRITGEVNRAWGYVKEVDGKAYVRFIRGKGLFAPIPILLLSAFCFAIFGFGTAKHLVQESWPTFLLISVAISLVTCGISAFQSTITEQGEAGHHEISRYLSDPQNYYC